MNNQTYGYFEGQPIDPGEGKEIVPKSEAMLLSGEKKEAFDYLEHLSNPPQWVSAPFAKWMESILAFRRPITIPPLPFTKESGFDYIVTEIGRKYFAPLRNDDEFWHEGWQRWIPTARGAGETFHHAYHYRRRKTKEANTLRKEGDEICHDHMKGIQCPSTHRGSNAREEANLASLELYGTICIHHNDAERKFDRCPVCLIKQLRTTIDDHAAKALITDRVIKLATEEVTRLHAIIDAQVGEAESLKLQNAGLHMEFMKMAQHIAVLRGDKYSLQSTIDAQKKAIDEADKALQIYGRHYAYCTLTTVLGGCNCGYSQAMAAIKQLEEKR